MFAAGTAYTELKDSYSLLSSLSEKYNLLIKFWSERRFMVRSEMKRKFFIDDAIINAIRNNIYVDCVLIVTTFPKKLLVCNIPVEKRQIPV